MSNIYTEAIADAKKLKEIAEKNATNRIIESIAPKIRQLIEQEIDEELDQDLDLDFGPEDSDDSESGSDGLMDIGADLPPAPAAPAISMDSLADPDPESDEESEEEKNVTVNITVESSEERRARLFREKAVDLVLSLKEAKTTSKKRKILSELKNLKALLVINNRAERKLGNEINEVLKESNMSNKTRRSSRHNNAWWLFEADDEEVNLGAEEGEKQEDQPAEAPAAEDVDVDAIKSAVEDLASAIGLEVEEDAAAADKEPEADDGDEDLDLDLDEVMKTIDEMEAKDEAYNEVDKDEAYKREVHHEADKQDEMRHGKDKDEMKDPMDEADDDKMIEISEAALRREIVRMRRAQRRRISEIGDPVAAMHDGADEVIDVSREDLINALAEELAEENVGLDLNPDGSGDAAAAAEDFGGGSVESGVLPESRRRRRSRSVSVREARQRRALTEARRAAAAAKRELQESNLFNAKLLYVNKLMQQHDLNSKQQRAIVEALDNAKTQREAKLLYTSLTESLRRRKGGAAATGSTLSEGLVRGGSSSNPTKSAAPTNNGNGLDRWATLAGIKK